MRIQEFYKLAAKLEGKKKQEAIAQMREAYKVANKLTKGEFYKLIKATPFPEEGSK